MAHGSVRVFLIGLVAMGLTIFSASSSPAQSAGETVFKSKCAACHGPDGKGQVPMGKKLGAHDLSSAEVQKQTDPQLTEVITKGKNKMPVYEGKLTKEQIAQMVAYIREIGTKH